MRRIFLTLLGLVFTSVVAAADKPADSARKSASEDMASLETQFRELPMESRRRLGPLFWLHGNDSPQRLELELDKVTEGGNGCFTTESRPHPDWLGPGWWRDLTLCLEAAKRHDLKMWIFDEKIYPSQTVGRQMPPQFAAKQLGATAIDVEGPRTHQSDGHGGEGHIATVAGQLTGDGKVIGSSLIDLAPHIRDGKLAWSAPAGKWRIIKFTHVLAPGLGGSPILNVDGASKDCVDWFLDTVYRPHYDHFKADFGKTIAGYFYDEPSTPGDWGTELNCVLAEWGIDWKKAYVAYKFELAGEEQISAKYQYLDAFAETWGRTMFGGMTKWCHERGVKSIGHFNEHSNRLYCHPSTCAGDMMRLQGYSEMGAIDAVFTQFVMGKRVAFTPPTWQTPKLGSSISHVYGKPDDVAMVEIFGARGQDLTYREMKWWADHMQVSGLNFLIPHSFNPRAPYDTDCPPYFYNGGYEPRWPLFRVFADYSNRLSVMLAGGRHVCPVALLFMGQSAQLGRFEGPEDMSEALQDAQLDCDWLPYHVFEPRCQISGKEIQLYQERYKAVVVPSVEVIPYGTLAKVKEFFDAGGVVLGYGFLPTRSATLGRNAKEIEALCTAVWGEHPATGFECCRVSGAGGRSYFLPQKPTPQQLQQVLADAGIRPTLEVLAGETSGWLHVLHRVKAEQDIFLVCNQNHLGAARQFRFRAVASGEPECWDAVRNEITAIPFNRAGADAVEFSLNLEPLESVLLVFQGKRHPRPLRIEANTKPIRTSIVLARDSNPLIASMPPLDPQRPKTLSPVAMADPFRARFTLPADVATTKCRVCLEMDGLPDESAAVMVNGLHAGGMIGRPLRLDITSYVKADENTIIIEPHAPKSAQISFYGSAQSTISDQEEAVKTD